MVRFELTHHSAETEPKTHLYCDKSRGGGDRTHIVRVKSSMQFLILPRPQSIHGRIRTYMKRVWNPLPPYRATCIKRTRWESNSLKRVCNPSPSHLVPRPCCYLIIPFLFLFVNYFFKNSTLRNRTARTGHPDALSIWLLADHVESGSREIRTLNGFTRNWLAISPLTIRITSK